MPVAESGSEQAFGRAARNTLARAVGEFLAKLASLAFFAVLARSLGQSGVGVFVFALAWAEISMLLASLGLDRALVRWIARDRSRFADLFADSAAIKVTLAVPIALVSFVLVNVLTLGATTREVIYVLTLGALFEALTRAAVSVFTGFERSELTALCLIAQRILAAALGIAALAADYGVVTVAITYTTAAGLGFALSVVLLRRRLGFANATVDRRRWRSLGMRSIPFAIQDVFTVLLFRLDAVLLLLIATTAAVGRYGSAYRLFESTLFLTYALTAAFSPDVHVPGARQRPEHPGSLRALAEARPAAPGAVRRGLRRACSVRHPDALRQRARVGGCVPADTRARRRPDRASDALDVDDRLRRSPRAMVWLGAAMTVFNLGLNVALIPGLKERGSAIAMLATEAVFLVLAMRMALRTIGAPVRWVSMTAAPLLAGAAMTGSMLALRGTPGVALAVGLAIYPAVFVLAEWRISPADLRFVADFAKRRLRSARHGAVAPAAPASPRPPASPGPPAPPRRENGSNNGVASESLLAPVRRSRAATVHLRRP